MCPLPKRSKKEKQLVQKKSLRDLRVIDVDLDPEDNAILDAIWDEVGHQEAAKGNPPPGYIPRKD
jgi:hypothetical protein